LQNSRIIQVIDSIEIDNYSIFEFIIFLQQSNSTRRCDEFSIAHIIHWRFEPSHDQKGQGETIRRTELMR